MRRYLRDTFSPSMAVALLALTLALSGGSYAAVRLGHAPASHAAQSTLRPGKTMIGYFAGAGGDSTSGNFGEGITFPQKLPSSFNSSHVRYLAQGDPFTSNCPGLGRAKRGWACFYETESSEATLCCIFGVNDSARTVARNGTRLYWDIGDVASFADGQWVVRAP